MRFLIQICLGLIRNQTHRRNLSAGVVMLALLMLFCGSTFLSPWLISHPYVFFGFWLACLWFTILAFLLAAYDLVVIRRAGRDARRRLHRETFSDENEN